MSILWWMLFMLSLLLFVWPGRPQNPWLLSAVCGFSCFFVVAEVQLFFAHLQYLAPTTCLPAIGLMTIPCYNGNNGSLDPGTYVSCLLCYWCWCVDFYPLGIDLLMCIAMNCCRCRDLLSTCCCWRCPNSLLVDCIGRLGWNHQLHVMEICDYIFCICLQQLFFRFFVFCGMFLAGPFVNNPWVSNLFFFVESFL